jgi:hypothetical protein
VGRRVRATRLGPAARQLGGRPPEPLSSVVCVRGKVTVALVIGLALAAGTGCGSGESTGSAASASQSALPETPTPSTTTLETSSTETVAGPQKSRPCPPFTIGPASFSEIRVAGIDCFEARQLLDQTTLAKVRKNRNAWTYGGMEACRRASRDRHVARRLAEPREHLEQEPDHARGFQRQSGTAL